MPIMGGAPHVVGKACRRGDESGKFAAPPVIREKHQTPQFSTRPRPGQVTGSSKAVLHYAGAD